MSFWNSYLQGWKKFVDFEGRATRKEFWCFFTVNCAVLILTPLTMIVVGEMTYQPVSSFYIILIYIVISLILLLPSMAVGIRRMHDIGRSGWWFGMTYLLPLLNRLLDYIFTYNLSPQTYTYVSQIFAVILVWIPTIFVLILCCFKSKDIVQPIKA